MPQPFDLEKVKFGHPLVTRDGRAVQGFHDSGLNIIYPCVAHIPPICVGMLTFTRDGRSVDGVDNNSDLFLADPPKVRKERWVTLSVDSAGRFFSNNGDTKEQSEVMPVGCGYRILASTLINWEEPAS